MNSQWKSRGSAELVQKVLSEAPVLDGHNDLPMVLGNEYGYDIGEACLDSGNPSIHTDLPSLRAGGVGGQFWSVYVPSHQPESQAAVQVLEQIDCVHRLVGQFPTELQLAQTATDIQTAWKGNRIASLMGAEGGHSIAGSLAVLRMFRALGVTYMTLTHNDNTAWAASATGAPVDYGLTEFGREVVAEMNRIGMLADLSHVHERTMHDALDVSCRPVIFSHSCCRAVTDHPRNVPDGVLSRLSANGGVLMLSFVPSFLTTNNEATVEDVVAHVEHARQVAGIEHIGLGGDYDGVPAGPSGMERVNSYPVLLRALAERGWSEQELAKLTSGNILRVITEAIG
ncbi:dipeptidase [Nesterenkonia ebinurensis]|uniref:dipeptidase n=1 Tax=Nesterenkonia ebinurensis TaxID=2608252 RepID=UPI001CC78DFE|nr:dipeptidase [Nesterenkonia ebinurensis]